MVYFLQDGFCQSNAKPSEKDQIFFLFFMQGISILPRILTMLYI
jgi:hypothetical protein